MISHLQDRITLNDGTTMPPFGFGAYKLVPGDEAHSAARWALEAGYRHLDTAAVYGNEANVGQAIRESGIPREQLFVTTKLWNDAHGYDNALRACETSLKTLGLDYVDLYLIHWPGQNSDNRLRSWDALLELKAQQKTLAVGVSNFLPHHLDELITRHGTVPAVDQVELHPMYPQKELRAYAKAHDILITAWGPLLHGHLADLPEAADIAAKYGKTAAQAILRWHIQHGISVIPKSAHQSRIIENADVFDFELSPDDMAAFDAMDSGTHFGSNPNTFSFGFVS